jgi:hypothetical protein
MGWIRCLRKTVLCCSESVLAFAADKAHETMGSSADPTLPFAGRIASRLCGLSAK